MQIEGTSRKSICTLYLDFKSWNERKFWPSST